MNVPEPVLPDPDVPGQNPQPVEDPPLPTIPSTYEVTRTPSAGGIVAGIVETTATALWVGANAGFAFVAAPVAFTLIPDRDRFATFTEQNLKRLATLTFGGAAVAILGALGRGRFEPAGRRNDVARIGAAALALGGIAYHQRAIVPRMLQAQRAMGGFADTAVNDPQRIAYRALHHSSTRVTAPSCYSALPSLHSAPHAYGNKRKAKKPIATSDGHSSSTAIFSNMRTAA